MVDKDGVSSIENTSNMYQTRKLILVGIAKVIGKDKKTGDDFTTYKHEFLQEDGNTQFAYANNEGYIKDVCPVLKWEAAKAQDFLFESREFMGEVKWKLVERMKATALLRELNAKK